jgi:hypothetical protein
MVCLLVGFVPIVVAETAAQPSSAGPTYYWFDGPHAWAVMGPFDQWYGVFEEKAYPIGSARDPQLWRTDVCLGPVRFRLPVSAPASVLLMLGIGVAGVVALSIWFRSGARTRSHVASNA